MNSSVYILADGLSYCSKICGNLCTELSKAGVEYRIISADSCRFLTDLSATVLIPIDADILPALKHNLAHIPDAFWRACTVYSVIGSLSAKELPTLLTWHNVVAEDDIPAFVGQFAECTVDIDGCTESVDILGRSIKTSAKLIDLSHSDINDISDLAKLYNLRGAFLQQNSISDLSALEQLDNLRLLFLYENKISSISPLASLKELGILYLFSNNIADISPLDDLQRLFDLRLSFNNITDISPLAGLQHLRTLHISGNNVRSLDALSSLSEITELYAADCGLCDIQPLSKLKGLETLDLCDNGIKDIGILRELDSLRFVKLYGNPLLQHQIDSLRRACPLCEILF